MQAQPLSLPLQLAPLYAELTKWPLFRKQCRVGYIYLRNWHLTSTAMKSWIGFIQMQQDIGLFVRRSQNWPLIPIPWNTLHSWPYLDEKCPVIPGGLRRASFPAKVAICFGRVCVHHPPLNKWQEVLGIVVILSWAGWMQFIGVAIQNLQCGPSR